MTFSLFDCTFSLSLTRSHYFFLQNSIKVNDCWLFDKVLHFANFSLESFTFVGPRGKYDLFQKPNKPHQKKKKNKVFFRQNRKVFSNKKIPTRVEVGMETNTHTQKITKTKNLGGRLIKNAHANKNLGAKWTLHLVMFGYKNKQAEKFFDISKKKCKSMSRPLRKIGKKNLL